MHRHLAASALLAVTVVALLPPPVVAQYMWSHAHRNYSPVPSGRSAIIATYGQPCNADARGNRMTWVAADNRVAYPVSYHRKLGGFSVMHGGRDDPRASSNLNYDVRGHITQQNLNRYVTHGIYGYACRRIRNSSKWSAHAWGLAVDISSAANPFPTSICRNMPAALIRTWTDHGWTHGRSFSDCMHFQYARNY